MPQRRKSASAGGPTEAERARLDFRKDMQTLLWACDDWRAQHLLSLTERCLRRTRAGTIVWSYHHCAGC